MKVIHPLDPIYNQESKVLILGSFPSIKSREDNFYYANPRNRFFPTLEKIFHEKIEANNEARKQFLLSHKIALFDVVKECDIKSSSDSSIKNVVPNDVNEIILNTTIKAIFTTGTKAYDLYNKYLFKDTGIVAIKLPSPSPANCKKGIEEELVEAYSKIKYYLEWAFFNNLKLFKTTVMLLNVMAILAIIGLSLIGRKPVARGIIQIL